MNLLHLQRAAVLTGALLTLAASLGARAESQYGYDATGTSGARTATAKLDINIVVPKLILLRVGSSGTTVNSANLTAALNTGIPGGVNNPLTDGSNNASGWDGTAPVWTTATSSSVQAWAWTNASGGGKVDAAVTTALAGGAGLTAADVTVASTAVSGGGLAHPGTDTGTNATTTFTRNTIVSSNWVFSVSASALAGAAAGSYTQQMTYTATTL
ncbi:hypothetical protein [Variovorax terrae]|uniref:WxL domain-containing protein n=1 Tax=Variovorax terrae TaxID=2923278 RepID=A0A9X1VXE9_9BURK|nr:hypothetical protein [Variovorax terrae]MCJ0764775.1 hypothetical protein [Variovorax terrae]